MVIFISSVFVPSHITGFFEIVDNPDPFKKGSKGAGIVLDKGILTRANVEEGHGNIEIKINGKSESELASITHKTVDLINQQFKLDDKKIVISHEFEIPIGTGFGVSAACALGTSLAIAKSLNLPLTYNNAAAIAHLTEIEMHSGLGDVIAEVTGGLAVRLKEGAPGFGVTDKIIINPKNHDKTSDDYFIITKTLGELETSSVIEDPVWKSRINHSGHKLLHNLLKKPDIETFFKLSRRFAEETSLMSPELKELVEILDDETIGASMAMLGNTAFALSKTPDTSLDGVMISKIDDMGCRFV